MPLQRLLCLALPALVACSAASNDSDPFASVPVSSTVMASGCADAPVDILRDDLGIPHIYARSLGDATCAQGYVMGGDRLIQMDLARRLASGTLAELLGTVNEGVIDSDIAYRVHHLRGTAEQVLAALQASSDPDDQRVLLALTRFSAGVNLAIEEFRRGDRAVPDALALLYDPRAITAWSPVDSLTIARLQSFQLAFDANSELQATRVEVAARDTFSATSADPLRRARAGLASDLYRRAPLDPAFALPDASGGCSGTAAAPLKPPAARIPALPAFDYAALAPAVRGVGADRTVAPARGSNNWVVSATKSKTGNALVANDTHLDLSNPAIFYLQHLVVPGELEVFGEQFPGLPGVVLGMNRALAWGATVTQADVTDVYAEAIQTCDGAPCVKFNGAMVALKPRVEELRVGGPGQTATTRKITLWDVPHHGPIVPRIKDHAVEPLGAQEFSVRYTGHAPTNEVRAVLGIDRATTVREAMAAVDRDFRVGGQNWIFADQGGHIGWDTHVELPVRPAGVDPGRVLPGDGSAEWAQAGVPAEQQPRAYDPACGFVVTANNDPLGATGGVMTSIYHGWDYDPGARAGRITSRLRAGLTNGGKLDLAALQSIQGDHDSFLGKALAAVLLEGGDALLRERTTPGTAPELTDLAATLDSATTARLRDALDRVRGWGKTAPAGVDHEASAAQVRESIATSIFNVWLTELLRRTLDDEMTVLRAASGGFAPGTTAQRKLLVTAALWPERLAVPRLGADSLLFDDMTTPRVEGRREIAARALAAALASLEAALGGSDQWLWGRLHRLTLAPLLPVAALAVPDAKDPLYPTGVPRHGDLMGVDVGEFFPARPQSLKTDYTYDFGPAIRFVAELTPEGPRAFNVLPGGQVFDPASPHYADHFPLWRKNQAQPLAFAQADVVSAVTREVQAGRPARVRLASSASLP